MAKLLQLNEQFLKRSRISFKNIKNGSTIPTEPILDPGERQGHNSPLCSRSQKLLPLPTVMVKAWKRPRILLIVSNISDFIKPAETLELLLHFPLDSC